MNMKKIIFFIAIIAAFTSCAPPEIGYISDDIHALEDTVFVPRGVFMTSAAPNPEGSTYPLTWKVTEVLDDNGDPTNALFEKHEILVWTSAFNPNTDTTLKLAEAKLKLSPEPSLKINNVSGEMAFTQATKFVTDNNLFTINTNVSNIRGNRQLDDFVVVRLMPFIPVEFTGQMRSRLNMIKTKGGKKALFTAIINNDNDNGVPSVLDGTHPYFSITKASNDPAFGLKVNMTITDSHDKPFSPSQILFYPYKSGYLQNYHDNSTETVNNETSITFSLPAPPFPQYSRNNWGDLMYYITSRDVFTVDKEAYEAKFGTQDWSAYKTNDNGDIVCEAYIRWAIKINDSGTWDIKMRIPYSKKFN
jgi:hypothetical protein